MNVKNKTIWITGASDGIGKALAIQLAAQGAKIILTARSVEKLQAVKANLSGDGHLVYPMDLLKLDAIPQAAEAVLDKMKILTITIAFFTFANLQAQSDSIIVDSTLIKLETRAERKAYRKALMAQFQKDMGKQFNTPCVRCIYFTGHVGYGFPFLTIRQEAPYDFLGVSEFVEDQQGNVSDKLKLGTVGQGYRMGIGMGMMFNNYIGAEILINHNRYTEVTLGSINTPNYQSSLSLTAIDLAIMPQLVLQSPNLNNFYLYTKIGAFIPFYGYGDAKVNVVDREGRLIQQLADDIRIGDFELGPLVDVLGDYGVLADVLEPLGYEVRLQADVRANFLDRGLKETLKTVIGFTAVAGFKYQFSKTISISGELRYMGFHVSFVDTRVQNANIEVDLLGIQNAIRLNENDLHYATFNTNYVSELTQNSNNPDLNPTGFDDSLPVEELSFRTSTSVLSANIGFQFSLPNRKMRKQGL